MLKLIAIISTAVITSACMSTQPGGQTTHSVEDHLMFVTIDSEQQHSDANADTANEVISTANKAVEIEVNQTSEQTTIEIDEKLTTVSTANKVELENKQEQALKIQAKAESLSDIIVQLIKTANLSDADKAKIKAALN